MSRPKVYISKSNLASYDHLIKLRSELAKLEVEIIEYDGKTPYCSSIVNNADYMLVLTYDGAKDENTYFTGKGVYTEIQTFTNKKNIYVVNPYGNYILINKLDKISLCDVNSWTRLYGKIITEHNSVYLPGVFKIKENDFTPEKTVIKKTNNYKYLLLTI